MTVIKKIGRLRGSNPDLRFRTVARSKLSYQTTEYQSGIIRSSSRDVNIRVGCEPIRSLHPIPQTQTTYKFHALAAHWPKGFASHLKLVRFRPQLPILFRLTMASPTPHSKRKDKPFETACILAFVSKIAFSIEFNHPNLCGARP